MIPIQLTLHNFMAYQMPQTLDFSEWHVACLTGENGAGKSSLLDAITWALWGKARTRMDDNLIHLGESEMSVEFTFALGDATYRVLRRRKAGKRGKTELHLHGFAPDAGDWRTLTDGGVRGTQAKINHLLHLDYDTFINSAFLLQGHADEFTTKTAAERKQILSDVLGLGIYDEYEQRAAEKVRQFEQEVGIVEGRIAQMRQELSNEETFRRQWETHQQAAHRLLKALQQAENELSTIRQQQKEMEFKHRQLLDLQSRLKESQVDIDDLTAGISRLRRQISGLQDTISRRDEIETGYKQWQAAKARVEDMNTRLAKVSALSREQHRLENIIQHARSTIETEIKVLQSRKTELTARLESVADLTTRQAALREQISALEKVAETLEVNRQKLTALAEETARLKTENKQLMQEMDTIKARLSQLEEAGSSCPVCTQPLNEEHRAAVRAKFTADGTARGDKFRANKARLSEIAGEQKTLQTEIRRAEGELRRQNALHGQLAKITQQLEQAQKASETLAAVEASLAKFERQLTDADFAVEETAALAKINEQISALDYDPQIHEMARAEMQSLAAFETEWQALQHAQAQLVDAEARLAKDEARQKRLLAQTAADRETMARLTAETAALPEVTQSLAEADATVTRLQGEERQAREAMAAARQQLDHLANVATEVAKKDNELIALKETQVLYKELRAAFGKKGVQALLIEHAIPELEEEANQLLSRMTDGRVNVQFVTQRTARTNDNTIETLDIRIADELGTRNYELYSGGETFRVNFAIRIALSKVLARRAGTNLQTLVIDEGFGTQDARGRERLVEAINSIQDDFEKIVVITHIEELQSAFPHHILVEKTDRGSVIVRD